MGESVLASPFSGRGPPVAVPVPVGVPSVLGVAPGALSGAARVVPLAVVVAAVVLAAVVVACGY